MLAYRLLIAAVALTLSACAEAMTPLQQRAFDAFRDCQRENPSARLTHLGPDGRLAYTASPPEYLRVRQCLHERYGYRFTS
ncbi:MAG TPA: hypothetical protein VFO18_00500 [Methylomirabilota bacterium]|nr:hypothetical protein [Methylomirabilota bacterium]